MLPQQREGSAPKWPLSRATDREMTVWREMWTLPQAIVWEEQKSFRQVGMHVRTSVEAEERGATSALRSLLLRQETNLLLVDSALLRAGYRISLRQGGPAAAPQVASGRPVVDIRARWQVPESSRGRLRAANSDEVDDV